MDPCPRPIRYALTLARLYRQCGFSRSAAALAYFLVLTLFPLLLCVSHFAGGLLHLLQPLEQLLPAQGVHLLEEYLSYAAANRSPGLFFAGLFTILFSASAGLRTVFLTMDQLFCHTPARPLLRFWFSPVLALFLLLVVYLSVGVVFTGDWFFRFLERHLPALPLPALGVLWGWTRYLVLFCSTLALVLSVYRAAIPRRVGGRAILLAALTAALGLLVCAALFSGLVGLSSRYALVYGSLAGLMVLLAWLYACGLILLLGSALLRARELL